MLIFGRLLIDPGEAPERGWLRVENGRIVEMEAGDPPASAGPPDLGGRDRLVCPAFFDAHTHLPQIDSVGCDGLPLLEWLDRVIFPAEAWWGDGAARSMARKAIRRMAMQGTCGFAGYLTSDAASARSVLDWIETATPMRMVAGRVQMDCGAPDALTREDRERAAMRPIPSPIVSTGASQLQEHTPSPRAWMSANPRFALACTRELMAEVGWAREKHPGMFVQTHLSESPDELKAIAAMFPESEHYTAIYDRAGLLGPRTLLAHCIHLSDAEWALLRERDSVAVHCPGANVFLEAGLFQLDRAEAHGVRVALGTDVAAGPDIAMPRVARGMIETVKVRRMLTGENLRVPSPVEAWEMITRRNADVLGWHDCGRLGVGMAGELLVLRLPETWMDDHLIGRLIYNWSHDMIEHRVFGGRVFEPASL